MADHLTHHAEEVEGGHNDGQETELGPIKRAHVEKFSDCGFDRMRASSVLGGGSWRFPAGPNSTN